MTATKDELIKGLNEDLAAEWGTIMRYTYQASKAIGLRGAELRELLEKEIPDELGHAKYLTDAITDLGGEPQMQPKDFEKPDDIKGMVELDLRMEEQDIKNYGHHAEMAQALGMTGLKVKLEDLAMDEYEHARDLRRILKGL